MLLGNTQPETTVNLIHVFNKSNNIKQQNKNKPRSAWYLKTRLDNCLR